MIKILFFPCRKFIYISYLTINYIIDFIINPSIENNFKYICVYIRNGNMQLSVICSKNMSK